MLLPILKDYLKKAEERASILKSGDQLLDEISKGDLFDSKATQTVYYY